MTSIKLRPATPNDLPTLKYWDEQPHVLEAGTDDWGWATELHRQPPWREQLIAELNGRPIGFLQIIDPAQEDSHYWGKDIGPNKRAIDIWIGEADALGKGYGTTMMQQAFARCFTNPAVTEILIDPLSSNARAIQFYRRLGFEFVAFRTFYDDHCAVHRLRRSTWEAQIQV